MSGTIRGCQREIKRIHESAILKETNAEIRNKMTETKTEFDDRMEEDEWFYERILLTCYFFSDILPSKHHKLSLNF